MTACRQIKLTPPSTHKNSCINNPKHTGADFTLFYIVFSHPLCVGPCGFLLELFLIGLAPAGLTV